MQLLITELFFRSGVFAGAAETMLHFCIHKQSEGMMFLQNIIGAPPHYDAVGLLRHLYNHIGLLPIDGAVHFPGGVQQKRKTLADSDGVQRIGAVLHHLLDIGLGKLSALDDFGDDFRS